MTEAKTTRPKSNAVSKQDDLLERLEKVEKCLEHVATNSGQGNLLKEYGLTRWEPSKNDMRKYKQ